MRDNVFHLKEKATPVPESIQEWMAFLLRWESKFLSLVFKFNESH
jgi:hypothetical protein